MTSPDQRMRIGIIMGSDSDIYGTMIHAGRTLVKLGLESTVDFEERVISAHRTPDAMHRYAEEAEERGLRVVIAGAGGSAHLPGNVASKAPTIPILGVAVTENPDVMNRALGSMIGLPEGTPVGVFQGKTGAINAAQFAVRMLAYDNPELRQALIDYNETFAGQVGGKDTEMSGLGGESYIENHPDPKAK